jgi:hypothetical protein
MQNHVYRRLLLGACALLTLPILFSSQAQASECPACDLKAGLQAKSLGLPDVSAAVCSVEINVSVDKGSRPAPSMDTHYIQTAALKALGFEPQDIQDWLAKNNGQLLPYDAVALSTFIETATYIQSHPKKDQGVLLNVDHAVCEKLKDFVADNHEKKKSAMAINFGPVKSKKSTIITDVPVPPSTANLSAADRAEAVSKKMGFDLETIATIQNQKLDPEERLLVQSFGLNPDQFPKILSTFVGNLGAASNPVDSKSNNEAYVHVRIPVLTNANGLQIRLDQLVLLLANERKKPCDLKIDVSNFLCSDQPSDRAAYAKMWNHPAQGSDARVLTQEDLLGKVKDAIGLSPEAYAAYKKAFPQKGSDPLAELYDPNQGKSQNGIVTVPNENYSKFYQACRMAQSRFQRTEVGQVVAPFDFANTFMDKASCKRLKGFATYYRDSKDEKNALAFGSADEDPAFKRIQLGLGTSTKTPEENYQATMSNLGLSKDLLKTLEEKPTPEEIAEFKANGIDPDEALDALKKFHDSFKTSVAQNPKWMGYNYDQGSEVRVKIPVIKTHDGEMLLTDVLREVALKRQDQDADIALKQHEQNVYSVVKALASYETNGVSDAVLKKVPESWTRGMKKTLDVVDLCFDGSVKGAKEANFKMDEAIVSLLSFDSTEEQREQMSGPLGAKIDAMIRDAEGKGQIRKNSKCFSTMHGIGETAVTMGYSTGATLACAADTGGNIFIGASCGAAVFAVSEMGSSYKQARESGASESDANIKALTSLFGTQTVMAPIMAATAGAAQALAPEEGAVGAAFMKLASGKFGKVLTEAEVKTLQKSMVHEIADVVNQCAQMSLFTAVGNEIAQYPNADVHTILNGTATACRNGAIMGVAFKGLGGGKDLATGKVKSSALQYRVNHAELATNDVIVTPQGDLNVTKIDRQKNQAFAQDAKGNVLVYNLKAVESAAKNPTIAKANSTKFQTVVVDDINGQPVTGKTPLAEGSVINVDGKTYKVTHLSAADNILVARSLVGQQVDMNAKPFVAPLKAVETARATTDVSTPTEASRDIAQTQDQATADEKTAVANAPRNRVTLKERFSNWLKTGRFKNNPKIQVESEAAISSVLEKELSPDELTNLEKLTEEGGKLTPKEFEDMLITCGEKPIAMLEEKNEVPGILVGSSFTAATSCHI